MSWFGKLLGTDKALSGVVNGVRDGLDALIYTDEEKATDAAADRSEARKMVVQWMAATQGQNIARRLIALSITGSWLGLYLVSVACGIASVFLSDTNKFIAVSEIAKASANDMNAAVMLILAFYFAAPHMGDIAKAVSSKFTKKIDESNDI